MNVLRESALAVLREATWASKAQRKQARERMISRAQSRWASLFKMQGALFLRDSFPKLATLFLQPAPPTVQEASWDGDLVDAFADVFNTTRSKAERAMIAGLFDGLADGYGTMAEELGIEASFKLGSRQAMEWATKNAAARVTSINDTTRTEIRDLIARGVKEGRDYGSVAREIRDTFDGFTRQRAEMVAVTENANSYENGARSCIADIEAVGITMEKSWSTVGGDECDICAENESAGWIPIDEAFPSGDQTPPNHPNCRCACLYQVAGGSE